MVKPKRRHRVLAKDARKPAHHAPHAVKTSRKAAERPYIKTGIKGFDTLFEHGIRKGSAVLLAGGAGSGKTLLGRQILCNAASEGRKALYMTFEESEERLREHADDFGWDVRGLEKKGHLMIKRFDI